MTNNRTSNPAFLSTAWKAAFAAAVARRLPELNPDAADEASDDAFDRCGRLSPEAAAATWVDAFEQKSADALRLDPVAAR